MNRKNRRSHRTRIRIHLGFSLLACVFIVSVGCGAGRGTLEEVDPDAAPLNPTYDQVYSIFFRECIPCHAGSAAVVGGSTGARMVGGEDEAAGAFFGVEPNLETCQRILLNLRDIEDDILVLNKMPPGAWPRLTEAERLTIERWINDGAPSPCQ